VSWTVPLTDVVLSEDDVASVLECLGDGWLTMGPRTEALERALAELLGAEHAVAVSSGTAALHLALLAAGVAPGDEVLVPAFTFVAGAGVVRHCGARPVFVEPCGPDDFNLDPDDAARRIGPQTRALLATHWMGYACDLPALERLCDRHGLLLIEDCAQSITAACVDGRLTGTVGAAGCFSFFSKHQLCVGEGGMIITADGDIAAKARSLRSHAMTSATWERHTGHADSYDVVDVGFNFRIDEARAALGLSRLPRLHADIAKRRALVRSYRDQLASIERVTCPWTDEEVDRSAHFGFPIVLETPAERDRVARELTARRIQTTWYPALTTLSAYRDHRPCPRAEGVAARHLGLPLSCTFTTREVDHVVSHLTEIVAAEDDNG
jgi:dTDP-4-amino-4,6-dideoxygalactose transaminase